MNSLLNAYASTSTDQGAQEGADQRVRSPTAKGSGVGTRRDERQQDDDCCQTMSGGDSRHDYPRKPPLDSSHVDPGRVKQRTASPDRFHSVGGKVRRYILQRHQPRGAQAPRRGRPSRRRLLRGEQVQFGAGLPPGSPAEAANQCAIKVGRRMALPLKNQNLALRHGIALEGLADLYPVRASIVASQ